MRTALRALEPHCDVELVETQRRGHAIELAAEAVALGLRRRRRDGRRRHGQRGAQRRGRPTCRSACCPAGGTSVLPRALGLPREHRRGRRRRSARRSCAGARAEHQPRASSTAGASRSPPAWAPTRRPCGSSTTPGGRRARRPGDVYFAAQIMRTLLRGEFREPQLDVSACDGSSSRAASASSSPTCIPGATSGPFALKLAPLATFEGGLDVVVPSDMRRRHLPRYATQLLLTGSQAYRTGPAARLPARRRGRARDRAAGRCRCTPTATTSATSRKSSSASPATPPGSSCERSLLLFDLDGTLVDSRAVVERHWGALREAARARLRSGARRRSTACAAATSSARVAPGARRRGRGGAAGRGGGGRHRRPRGRARRARACWPRCRPGAGASSPRDTARSPSGGCARSACRFPPRWCAATRSRGASPIRRASWPARDCSESRPQACVAVEDAPAGIAGRARGRACA